MDDLIKAGLEVLKTQGLGTLLALAATYWIGKRLDRLLDRLILHLDRADAIAEDVRDIKATGCARHVQLPPTVPTPLRQAAT